MRVDVILRHKGNDIISIQPDRTVQEAADALKEHGIGAILVREEDGDVLGVVSERDIVRGLAAQKEKVLDKKVSGLMTTTVVTCSPMDTVDEIMEIMTQKRLRHIPVKDGDALIGIISIGDVVKHRMSEIEHESDALRQYISAG